MQNNPWKKETQMIAFNRYGLTLGFGNATWLGVSYWPHKWAYKPLHKRSGKSSAWAWLGFSLVHIHTY